MPLNFFQPKPGRFGVQVVLVESGQIGGANFLGGASPLTANNTTTFRMPTPPHKARFLRLCASTVTVPADADGTIVARAVKYDGSAQTAVSADIDCIALTTRQITVAGPASAATEANRIFNGSSDALEVNVVNNSAAIDTQPAGLVFTAEFELLQ